MSQIKYEIQKRNFGWHAVLRKGPKGGTRLVAVYQDREAAEHVATLLNANAHREV